DAAAVAGHGAVRGHRPAPRGPWGGGLDGAGAEMRRSLPPLLVLALLLAAAPARAHVGNPNVFFDGDAGPYPVRVIVRPPAVIPGLAEITVRLRDGRQVDGGTGTRVE